MHNLVYAHVQAPNLICSLLSLASFLAVSSLSRALTEPRRSTSNRHCAAASDSDATSTIRMTWYGQGKARQDDLKVHASANTHNGEAHSPGLPSGHLVCVPSIADRRTLTGRWQPSTGTESARVPWLLRGTASTQKWNRKTCQEKSVLFWTVIACRTKNLELSTDWNVAYLSASEWMGISGRPSERSSWRINRWKAFVAIPAGSMQFSFFLISQNL